MKVMNRRNEVIKISRVLSLLPRNILSFTVFKWTFPLSLLLAVVSTPKTINRTSEVLIWLLIGALGHCAMLPFVIYGRTKSSAEQMLLVVLMGFTRGGVIAVLSPIFGVTDSLPAFQRILNSTVAVFYWSQAGAIVLEYGIQFRRRLKTLLNELLEKNFVGIPESAKKSENEIVKALGYLQERITATMGSAPSRLKLQDASDEIDRLIDDYIKPLSQSRWQNGELIWVRTGLFSVLKRILSLNPLPIFAIISLTFPFTLIAQLSRIGLIQTLQVQVVWTTLTLLLAMYVFPKDPLDGNYTKINLKFLFMLPMTYIATFVVQLTSPLENDSSLTDMFRGYALSAITQVIAYLVGALLLMLHHDQEFVFEFISNAIKTGELENLLMKTKSGNLDARFAQYVHAEVQSQLLACKLLLLKAADSDFELFSPEVTKQITDRLEKIKQPYVKPVARVPAKRLEELQESWAGLANITFKLPAELSQMHSYSDVTSQLIEESIVNSIRHGKATEIQVVANFSETLLHVEVRDNGNLRDSRTPAGLGTVLFNTFSNEWRLRRDDGKTLLTFSIETQGQE